MLPRRRLKGPYRVSLIALTVAYCCCSCVVAFHPLQDAATHRRQQRTLMAPSALGAITREADSSQADDDNLYNRELLSIAPMMGHTNRHYHFYFRLLSQRAHLYTEMIPSSQVLRAFKRARQVYLNIDARNCEDHPEEILNVVEKMKVDPGREYQLYGKECEDQVLTLHQLVGTSTAGGPVILQLGGRDPAILGVAAAIGSAFGDYDSVNLNCGCPSNAVGGRSGGCALMQEPDTVARCVEEMTAKTTTLSHISGKTCPSITVKHRLGVRQAATFDAQADRSKNDDEAYVECSSFVRTVSLGGDVSKFHVHARLGLLGEFAAGDSEASSSRQSLWVPSDNASSSATTTQTLLPPTKTKVDHKREQERAKRRARKATIQNRNVPPLRPNVVARLADEFPKLEFVSNGGIQSLSDVEQLVDGGLLGSRNNRVLGAMVGRAGINHPCSFAAADELWEKRRANGAAVSEGRRPTRGQVLQEYIQYCDEEEDRLLSMGASKGTMGVLRRRLIAVPFHLFMGEEGSDAFQRRLKKLKVKTDSVKASSILSGAALFVPSTTLDKCVDDFVRWDELVMYEGGLRRGSAMQRVVY